MEKLAAVAVAGITLGAMVEMAMALPTGAATVAVVSLSLPGAALLWWSGRANDRPGGTMSDRLWISGLLALFVLALLTRGWKLTAWPVWDDEMWTLRIVYGGSLLEVLRICVEDYWPPLHYLLQNVACRIGDTGVLTLRLPSVVAGSLTVLVVAWAARVAGLSRGAALISALLLALSVAHVLRSQESRVYPLLMLLTVWSFGALWQSLSRERVSKSYVAATTLIVYSHQLAFLVVIAHWTFLAAARWWLRLPLRLRPLLGAQVAVAVLSAPLFGAFLLFRLSQSQVAVPFSWASGAADLRLWDMVEMLQSLAVRSWSGAALVAVLTISAIACIARSRNPVGGGGTGRRLDRERKMLLMLGCWLVVPLALTFLISARTPLKVFAVQRYHLFMLPGLALLLGLGFDRIVGARRRMLLVGAVAAIGVHDLYGYYSRFDRLPYDQAAAFVREHRQADEMVYVGNAYRVFSYYYKAEYPRIGGVQWREFEARFAHLDHLWTDHPHKDGSSYRSEKMPSFIEFVSAGSPTGSYYGNILALRQSGKHRFDYPFWIVLSEQRMTRLRADLQRLYRPCHATLQAGFGSIRVVRCSGPAARVDS